MRRAKPTGRRRWRRIWRWTGLIMCSGLFLLLMVGAYYYPKIRAAVAAGRQAQGAIQRTTTDLSQQKFAATQSDIDDLQLALRQADSQLGRMQGLRRWPYVGRQFRAVEQVLDIGQDSAEASHALVEFLSQLFAPFSGRGRISLATITPAEKGQLLATMSRQEEPLRQAQTAIHRAADKLAVVPTKGLIGPLQRVITPLKQQFPVITRALDQAIPATHLLPPLLGYPDPKQYLFLLLNNTELRPGGGFIGTYGLMKLYSGDIVSLVTDNSYNLDEAAKKLPIIPPPEPMQIHLKAKAWYFRDANWSPDFPTSAKQALLMYQREGGSRRVDGVVAVTPTTISALLQLVGPIKVGRLEFTADNFTDQLQKYVDVGYAQDGQSTSERKDIIGVLTSELVDRLLKLPLAEWKDLFLVLSQQLNQKQLLFYMNDSAEQNILASLNWAGSIDLTAEADYLQVVDANLASLKTDPAMARTYNYTVKVENGQAEATLIIHYRHTGKFDWKTTRYNTYVRVYVPSGSQLVRAAGMQLRERTKRPGKVDITTEAGKTVFGAFKSIEPGTSDSLTLVYRLPEAIGQQLSRQTYTMVWQKQPGMLPPSLDLMVITPGHRPQTSEGLDNQAQVSHSSLSFRGPLNGDRRIVIRYK